MLLTVLALSLVCPRLCNAEAELEKLGTNSYQVTVDVRVTVKFLVNYLRGVVPHQVCHQNTLL